MIPQEIAQLRRRSRRKVDRPAKRLNALQRSTRDRVLRRCETSFYTVEEAACVCGSSQGFCLAEQDRYGLPSPSVICDRCGVVRTTPRLTSESLRLFYEQDYRSLYAGAEDAPETFFARQVAGGRAIYEFTGPHGPFRRVADLGCGAGGTLLPFREAGCAVVGCDLGGAYLERGRKEGLDLRHGSYETLLNAGPFDLVVLSHVLEHIPDPYELLIKIKGLLTPDRGMIYAEVPGIQAISRFGDPLAYFQNAHLYNFDLGTLSRLFRSAGYELITGDEGVHSLFATGLPVEQLQVDPDAVRSNLDAIASAERDRVRNQLRRAIQGSPVGRAGRAARSTRRRLRRAVVTALPGPIVEAVRRLRSPQVKGPH